MNPKKETHENQIDELVPEESTSLDDFIKELEEKEKDLHISSDLVFEIEDDDNALKPTQWNCREFQMPRRN